MKIVDSKEIEGIRCKDVPLEEIANYEASEIVEMKYIMAGKFGVGLAAPQVGIKKAFFIMKYGNKIISCYNPSYRKRGDKDCPSEEGCLSYPGWRKTRYVKRHKMIVAKYTNSDGEPVQLKLSGSTAAIFQHETDHLVGKTIFFDPEKESD